MASDIAKDFMEQNMINSDYNQILYGNTPLSEDCNASFTKSRESFLEEPVSSYTLASDSQYSADVDLWIRGDSIRDTESAAVQNNGVTVVQRSTLASTSSMDANIWYVLAMILPLFGVNNCMLWRCTPSTVLNAAEVLLGHLSRFCVRAKAQLRRLARDQIAMDLFATAMDIVLVVYAIGFLVLSLYQASIIG